jgi:hypothetical protein
MEELYDLPFYFPPPFFSFLTSFRFLFSLSFQFVCFFIFLFVCYTTYILSNISCVIILVVCLSLFLSVSFPSFCLFLIFPFIFSFYLSFCLSFFSILSLVLFLIAYIFPFSPTFLCLSGLLFFYDYMLQSLICSQSPPFSFPHPLFGWCVCGCVCNVCVCAHASEFWYCSCLIPYHSGPAVGQAE